MQRPGFSPKNIEYFERDFLDELNEKLSSNTLRLQSMGNKKLYHIKGLPKFWGERSEDSVKIQHIIEDLVSGIFESKVPLIYSVFGGKEGLEVSYGTYNNDMNQLERQANILQTSLESSFHGIEIEALKSGYLERKLGQLAYAGILTGVPSETMIDGYLRTADIDRILRGISRRKCGFVVVGSPIENTEINSLNNMVLNEIRIILDSERHLGQENPMVRQYKALLEKYLEKLQRSKSQGLWISCFFMYSNKPETLNQLKALAKSSFSGRNSVPDRIRTLQVSQGTLEPGLILNPSPASPGQFKWPYMYSTFLSSSDLASFVKLPSQELPGFKIKPYVRFNLSQEDREGIKMGAILDQDEEIGKNYRIPVKGLKKHGLIVGGTGSGKTNTLFYILKELIHEEIPFLVLEPAKTEYRTLLFDEAFKDKLQVFTLGNNNISPFRLNPFRVPDGVSVQTHLDLLKSVFNASFYMWGPLPHVLEQCLNEIYRDKGWDLSSNTNSRGSGINAYPTLTDLYNKVDEVVERIGYSSETTMELKSSLKTRLNSLRIGGKGLMLDTKSSISFDELLRKPTVLELETLGDDEEKSFMLGLVLTMMYEYYVSKGISEELGHITVIEEAHRLLGNTLKDNAFSGDMKGKAVETFTNILSEIRAYGEGFLIADQIPTKLSTDVIKNTNLKVMHRIVAEDDRRVMASSMNIQKNEAPIVSTLYPLHAVVFSEGDDGAYHIKFPYVKPSRSEKDEILTIKEAMRPYLNNQHYLSPYISCSQYCNNVCEFKDAGNIVQTDFRFNTSFPKLILSIIEQVGYNENLLQMFEAGNDEALRRGNILGVKLCAVLQGAENYFERLGRNYYWSYEDQEKLLSSFLETYLDSLKGYIENKKTNLDQEKTDKFREFFRSMVIGKQPTQFCKRICNDGTCQYRYLLEDSLDDEYYHSSFVNTINNGEQDLWFKLVTISREVAYSLNPDLNRKANKKISNCFTLQKTYQIEDFSQRHIEHIMNNVLEENEAM
jgi:DNA helicase HerA-like ATPase